MALLLRNDLAFFEATEACRLSGAYMVPINWHFTAEEVEYILRDSDACVLVVHADLLAGVASVVPAGTHTLVVPTPPELEAAYRIDGALSAPPKHCWDDWRDVFEPLEAPAVPPGTNMLYTSGTTGRPKGVRRAPMEPTEADAYYDLVQRSFGIRPGMRSLLTGPLYHAAPFAHAHIGFRDGCDLLLMPRFDAEELLALIESERLTHMHVVPTMFVRLLRLPETTRRRYDVSSLACVVHGAAPCPVEIKRAMIDWWGPVIREYYGSTEASTSHSVSAREWLERPGTVGRAMPGVRVRIQSEDGRGLGPNEEGEIFVRVPGSPQFTYHRRDEERRAIEHDGLLTNGDIGYVDDAGYLFICDRKRDMIISAGVNIYPAEIESALLAHPSVRDCAVFGIPDPEFGERIMAAIEAQPEADLDAAALCSFLEGRLARYKIPSGFEFHEALPRLDNGKIYKQSLRAPFWAESDRRI